MLTCNPARVIVLNVLVIITLGMAGTVHAQETTKKIRLYKSWVKKTDSKTRLVGILYQVEDNKLRISHSFNQEIYDLNQFHYQDVYAHEINEVKLRRKGGIGRGVLIGFVSGFATGALIGLVSGNDPPCAHPPRNSGFGGALGYAFCEGFRMTAAEKAIGGGISLGLLGGIVGAVVGSLKIKIPINGSQEKFKANTIRLKGYSYRGLYGSKP